MITQPYDERPVMFVTRIDVIGLVRDETDSGHIVTVCLHGEDRRVFTRCEIKDHEVGSHSNFEDLVADKVVHQLRQMPEFRSGQGNLAVDPSLIPQWKKSA